LAGLTSIGHVLSPTAMVMPASAMPASASPLNSPEIAGVTIAAALKAGRPAMFRNSGPAMRALRDS
jgi:hypothetical protein